MVPGIIPKGGDTARDLTDKSSCHRGPGIQVGETDGKQIRKYMSGGGGSTTENKAGYMDRSWRVLFGLGS